MNSYYLDAIEAWKVSKSKPRGEWKLGDLTNEQLEEVLKKLLNGVTQRAAREFIRKDFQVSIDSDRSLSEFFSGVKHFLGSARRHAALAGVKLSGPLTQTERDHIDAAKERLLLTAINEKLDNPEIESSELGVFVKAFLKLRDQSLSERDIALKLRRLASLEAKEKQAQEAKEKLSQVTKKGGLTKETLREIEEAAKLL